MTMARIAPRLVHVPAHQFSVATNGYIGQGKEKAEYQYKGTVYPQVTVPALVTGGLCRRWFLWLSRSRVQ